MAIDPATLLAMKPVIESAAELVKEFGLPIAKEGGAYFGAHIRARTDMLISKTAQKILADGKAVPQNVPDSRKAIVNRSIVMGALSSGQNLLDYWAAVVAKQATCATDEEADIVGGTVSILESLTDTHAKALVLIAQLISVDESKNLSQPRRSDPTCFLDTGRLDILFPMTPYQQAQILEELVRLRLVGMDKTNMNAPYMYLTVSGMELLKFGGWIPRRAQEWQGVLSEKCRESTLSIFGCWALRQPDFQAIEIAVSPDGDDVFAVFNDGRYFIHTTGVNRETGVTPVQTKSGQFMSTVSRVEYSQTAPMSAIIKGFQDYEFSEFLATARESGKGRMRAERVAIGENTQRWSLRAYSGEETKQIDVTISHWLYTEMEEIFDRDYQPHCDRLKKL